MLSNSDNDMLTQVGSGTPMGDLLRRYWMPAVLSTEVSADGVPHRTRLLGEDLIVFRVTSGAVGVAIPTCPHRGASLYFGRNEEEGIRCAYHGWKFDVHGACVDMPSEPSESNFRAKVSLKAYVARERNGIIWIYMGPSQDTPPDLPALEWNLVPEGQRYLSKRVAQNNFMQALEGEIDSSHSGFLHSRFNDPYAGSGSPMQQGMVYKMRDKHPRFQTVDTDYGVLIGARRNAEEDSFYWRITQYLFPFHTIIPPYGDNPSFSGHAWIPMDDYHTLAVCFTYHPTETLTERALEFLKHGQRGGQEGLHPTVDAFLPQSRRPEGAWWPRLNIDNDFGVDWELQRSVQFSGLPGTWPQDSGMQETMGPIFDRTQEHLGVSDSAIIRTRRRLILAAKQLRDLGLEPSSATDAEVHRIRSAAIVLPRSEDWVAGSLSYREALSDVNHAAV